MKGDPALPSSQAKLVTWLALLLLAAIAWTVILLQIPAMDSMAGDMAEMSMEQGMATMAAEPASLLFFLPLWVSMMVAMMFPAVAPVVSLFAALSRKRREIGQPAAPTWLFLSGYLVVWGLLAWEFIFSLW